MQADQQKMMADAQLKQAEMQARVQLEKMQAQADMASNDRKVRRISRWRGRNLPGARD